MLLGVKGSFSRLPVPTNLEKILKEYEVLNNKNIIFCSDAHYLDKIPDKSNYFEFEENLSDNEIREKVIKKLQEKVCK